MDDNKKSVIVAFTRSGDTEAQRAALDVLDALAKSESATRDQEAAAHTAWLNTLEPAERARVDTVDSLLRELTALSRRFAAALSSFPEDEGITPEQIDKALGFMSDILNEGMTHGLQEAQHWLIEKQKEAQVLDLVRKYAQNAGHTPLHTGRGEPIH